MRFAGTPDGPEARLAQEAGLVFHAVSARGFDRSRPVTLVTASARLLVSAMRMWRTLGTLRPDVVVCFGGYVSLPVGVAAIGRGIPVVVHEQNAVPGMANRVLARWACAVGVTYRESIPRMPRGARCEHTGNPVRVAVMNADRDEARAALAFPAGAVVLLVFGGSRGARRINEAVSGLRDRLLANERVWVLHVTGCAEPLPAHEASAERAGDGVRYRRVDYIDDMGAALAAADLVVARAGATSIAEITAIGRAAILVPYPYATGDHQTHNARDVAQRGGALVVSDDRLDTEDFAQPLEDLLDDAGKRAEMARVSRASGVRDAAARLEALILRCAGHAVEGGSA